MFPNFELKQLDLGEVSVRVRYGGSGPPLLLLHGHPQTHVMWHRVALMAQLSFEQFFVAGHDRGGRCAYRLALDHPQRVRKLAVLDIIPTGEAFRRANMAFGLGYWHWFFLAQPAPLPEQMIGGNPDNYYFRAGREKFDPQALADYLRACHNPETIHAMCEDYRAGATIDNALDEADRGQRRIASPLLALWAKHGQLETWYDVPAIWRDWADDVRGRSIDCGHFLAEEAPEETAEALAEFFGEL